MAQGELLSQQKLWAPCLAPEGGRGQVRLWSMGLSSVQDSLLPFMSYALSTCPVSGARDTGANQARSSPGGTHDLGKTEMKQVTSIPCETCCSRDTYRQPGHRWWGAAR